MTNSVSSKLLGLLAGASVMALVTASAQARPVVAEVHGYMDHGKLVAVKVINHEIGGAASSRKKVPTYTYTYSFPYSATATAEGTAVTVVGWGLYDPTTCTGQTYGKMKAPTTKSTYGKWSTSITPVTGATTKSCPSGITGFSTANALFTFNVDTKKKITPPGTVVTGTSLWTAKLANVVDGCNMGTVTCNESYIITDVDTVTYSP